MKTIRYYAADIFKKSDEAAPWARMSICALATAGPLIVGLIRGELSLAIFGALLGYLIALNDHLGAVTHRMLVATLSFVVLIATFALGVALHDHFAVFLITTLALTYWLGLMGGKGAEVERLLLFAIIQILVAFYSRSITMNIIDPILIYGLIAYVLVLLGMIISNRIMRGNILVFAGVRSSILSSVTFSRSRHLYALSFLIAALLAIGCVQYFEIERGYWTIITVMLIMKPDQQESIYRSFQRFVGTLLGVIVGEATIVLIGNAEVLIFGIVLSAFFIPYAMKRNYWMVAFFVSVVVMFLLSLPSIDHPNTRLPFLRLIATVYGCLLSIAGVLIYRFLKKIFDNDQEGF